MWRGGQSRRRIGNKYCRAIEAAVAQGTQCGVGLFQTEDDGHDLDVKLRRDREEGLAVGPRQIRATPAGLA